MKFFSMKNTGVAICAGLSMTMSVNSFSSEISYLSITWLNEQINKHPDIVATNESMKAVFSKADDSKLPLYNPELSTSYEREGVTSTT